jgi:DNA-directed RNA polymerase specialized sigma24 family protein
VPQYDVSPSEILTKVRLFHAITHRLVNGAVEGDRAKIRAQWLEALDPRTVATMTKSAAEIHNDICDLWGDLIPMKPMPHKPTADSDDVDPVIRTECDRAAVRAVLDRLIAAAVEREIDASRFYDVTGDVAGATVQKWDAAWSLVRSLNARANAELRAPAHDRRGAVVGATGNGATAGEGAKSKRAGRHRRKPKELTQRQRAVVELHEVQNQTLAAIADAWGKSPQSVQQLYERAKANPGYRKSRSVDLSAAKPLHASDSATTQRRVDGRRSYA